MKINLEQAITLANYFKINLYVIEPEIWRYALNVELEHKDITKNNLFTTGKIVIAHLNEYPDYYQRLKKMEKQAKKHWKNTQRPNIFTI